MCNASDEKRRMDGRNHEDGICTISKEVRKVKKMNGANGVIVARLKVGSVSGSVTVS